jgi:cysteine desulfurase
MVYLDHAATSPLCREAREAMAPYLGDRFGNASEPHSYGRDAREGLEHARHTLCRLLGCEPEQLVFTSGGTEADNQAVFGLAGRPLGRLVVSEIEHPAVRAPAEELQRQGFEVAWVGVDRHGVLDVDAFREALRPGDLLAAVMWANNVTGAVQPVAELAGACAEAGVPLHVDAVQAGASLPVDFRSSGAETLALSAHKMHGPKGVGALLARDPARLRPLIWGGGQERGMRSGTENVAGVAGFAAALAAMRELRVVSAGAPRLPGHSLLLVEGIRAELLVLALDRAGYAVSAGSACASGESEPSTALIAQGLTPDEARSVIRVSIGIDTTEQDVDGFAAELRDCIDRLRAGALV